MARSSPPIRARSPESGSIHLRRMRARDLDAALAIERACFDSPWSRGLFAREHKLPFAEQWVAEIRGAGIVGYVCWWLVADEMEIQNIAVHPEHRRRGLGRTLLEHTLGRARADAATRVHLEVRSDNRAALALYQAFGFQTVRMRKGYYGPGRHAVTMQLELSA